MRLEPPFDPLEVGEVDNFAFDFLADAGAARIVDTTWVCAVAPNQPNTVDPSPQSRVLSVSIEDVVKLRSPLSGILTRRRGMYSVASIGGLPNTAVGWAYILNAFVVLSDGRKLHRYSTLLCVGSGV